MVKIPPDDDEDDDYDDSPAGDRIEARAMGSRATEEDIAYSYGKKTGDFFMVPRKIWQQLRRKHHSAYLVYQELLSRAAWEPGPRLIGGQVRTLRAGQCVFGIGDLAQTLGLTPSAVRGALKILCTAEIIARRTTTIGSIATINGYRPQT